MDSPETGASSSDWQGAVPGIDTSVPNQARRYNYWLGGKDHFPADRESGNAVANALPSIRVAALENRRFLRRAVAYLVREAGIRQFLDIGTGLPTADNVHEVAQSIAPESRIVYVDSDPVVLVHARALLTSSAEGATEYLEADLREPDKILSHPDLLRTLDLDQPVGLMLIAVLHFLQDDEAYASVSGLMDSLPSGSYVAITHATMDFMPAHVRTMIETLARGGHHGESSRLRTRAELARFVDGLELIPPGLRNICEWWAEDEPGPRPSAAEVPGYAVMARKP
ncbi:MAG TPA: SAM-dependent methyltransferase [Micromonosporaceae bacterium]|nr:SAM-dependent methyltransferase [Micromonosporaceae bacterium]